MNTHVLPVKGALFPDETFQTGKTTFVRYSVNCERAKELFRNEEETIEEKRMLERARHS